MLVNMQKKNNILASPFEIIYALLTLYNEGKDKKLLFRLNKLSEIYLRASEIYDIRDVIAVKKKS